MKKCNTQGTLLRPERRETQLPGWRVEGRGRRRLTLTDAYLQSHLCAPPPPALSLLPSRALSSDANAAGLTRLRALSLACVRRLGWARPRGADPAGVRGAQGAVRGRHPDGRRVEQPQARDALGAGASARGRWQDAGAVAHHHGLRGACDRAAPGGSVRGREGRRVLRHRRGVRRGLPRCLLWQGRTSASPH